MAEREERKLLYTRVFRQWSLYAKMQTASLELQSLQEDLGKFLMFLMAGSYRKQKQPPPRPLLPAIAAVWEQMQRLHTMVTTTLATAAARHSAAAVRQKRAKSSEKADGKGHLRARKRAKHAS